MIYSVVYFGNSYDKNVYSMNIIELTSETIIRDLRIFYQEDLNFSENII